ncbi:hypothetical protein NZK35_18465 [Stieleria sp. ICT_E10.1]|nr:hypothetical protein [Stieleria sedimenti]
MFPNETPVVHDRIPVLNGEAFSGSNRRQTPFLLPIEARSSKPEKSDVEVLDGSYRVKFRPPVRSIRPVSHRFRSTLRGSVSIKIGGVQGQTAVSIDFYPSIEGYTVIRGRWYSRTSAIGVAAHHAIVDGLPCLGGI